MEVDERRPGRLMWVLGVLVALAGVGLLLLGDDGRDDPVVAPEPVASSTSAPSAGSTTASTGPEAPIGTTDPGSTLPGDPDRVPLEGFDEVAITVTPPGGGDLLSWCLLAARTAAQRSRGLMEVTDLQGYSGMAFVYEEDVDHSFYMRNTPTPLSIAWIAADGHIVSTADMEPCEDREGCPLYPPGGLYRTAIEVFRGGLDDLGITEGATVVVGGACAPLSSGA